jgi:hypothetical protein
LFGNAINTNEGLFLEFTRKEQEQMKLSKYIKDLIREQGLIIKKAQSLLKAHEVMHTSNGPSAITEFPDYSYVLLKYPPALNRKSKPPTKLHTNQRGPLKVLRHEGPDYWLLDIVTNKARKRPVHVSRLVPFKYNPKHTSPLDVARRDLDEFVILEVLEHRYTPQTERREKGRMEFLIRWLGYGPEWNSWEPWREVRECKEVHRYLFRVGLENEIPKQFRRDNYDVDSNSDDDDNTL